MARFPSYGLRNVILIAAQRPDATHVAGFQSTPTRPSSTCVRETEAEAVAHVICHAVGLDSTRSSADYVQLYHGDLAALNGSLQSIQSTAAQILVDLSRAEAVYYAREASYVAA